jgi:hypothetical protein
MATYDRRDDDAVVSRDADGETHATTGGAAAAGAVTGGVIGMAAGPVGAAVGAVGGAIVGAVTEGIMHSGSDADVDTVSTTTTRRWDDVSPTYRSSWERQYGSGGGRWEDYEPHYRYGWETANNPSYRGRKFDEIEPDLRRDWEGRYTDTSWDTARGSIRDAWSRRTGGGTTR